MNTEAIKNAVALAAQQYGADAYEIDINVEESAGAEALQQEISSVTYAKSGHMQIRCITGGKSGSAVSDLITPEAAAQLVAQACANAGIVDDADTVELFAGSESYATVSDAAARVAQLMADGLSRKDAIKQTAKELDLPKNVVYDIALKEI